MTTNAAATRSPYALLDPITCKSSLQIVCEKRGTEFEGTASGLPPIGNPQADRILLTKLTPADQ